ncbi:unnamed protein product [Linum trigynum]|uniref:Uncharacterized protein n=1 Tax=Linum trigynum TaxID=586398 RepID=A0AAV2EXF2_9ROSI
MAPPPQRKMVALNAICSADSMTDGRRMRKEGKGRNRWSESSWGCLLRNRVMDMDGYSTGENGKPSSSQRTM